MGTRIKEAANAKAAIYIHLCAAFIKNRPFTIIVWIESMLDPAWSYFQVRSKKTRICPLYSLNALFQLCPQLMTDNVLSKSINGHPVSITIGAWLLI